MKMFEPVYVLEHPPLREKCIVLRKFMKLPSRFSLTSGSNFQARTKTEDLSKKYGE